jgi:hypothetical protein
LQEYTTDGGCRNERLPHPQPDVFNDSAAITKQDFDFDEMETVDVLPQDLQVATPNISKSSQINYPLMYKQDAT